MTLFHLKRLDASNGARRSTTSSAPPEPAQRLYLDEYLHEYMSEYVYVGRYRYD